MEAATPATCAPVRDAAAADTDGKPPSDGDGGDSGNPTSYLYLAAAEACLGHWAGAERAFALAAKPAASGACDGAPYVYEFAKALIRADHASPPLLVDAAPVPGCPTDDGSGT